MVMQIKLIVVVVDKVKAIRCHYYRHIKESVDTEESCGAKDESDGISGD